ncbi:hypothetical protein [Hoyosella rhizosphaerae]|nr:hypothetical protein [Hoyosella rhizosphaerae]
MFLMGRQGVILISHGTGVTVAMGAAILVLPFLGAYVAFTTLQAGFRHQRLADLIAEAGLELDTSGLPRRPSGRVERAAADAFFLDVKSGLDAAPDDWRQWYRVARAYDIAGDRKRAREAMGRAVDMEAREARGTA